MPGNGKWADGARPRLLPERALPAYAYWPGRTPHPTRDPGGHGAAAAVGAPRPPDPETWRDCADYLYGLDLFNHGYYWEAHEAWEGLWVACGRTGTTAAFLQGLINLAAARFKQHIGNARGRRANAGTAARLFAEVAATAPGPGPEPARGRYMGFDVAWLDRTARAWRDDPGDDPAIFDVVLTPE